MEDYCQEPSLKSWMIVYKYSGLKALRLYTGSLRDQQIRSIMHQILKAMDSAHKIGIFHRDLKPANIILKDPTPDRSLPKIEIIDWGLSEYILPQKELNFRVSTRPFKAPEILL